MRCGDDPRNGQPVAEGGPDGFAGGNRLEEIPRLDDDLVLIAGAVARALAKGGVVRMCGASQDAGKAARRFRPFGAVKVDCVLVFLIKLRLWSIKLQPMP